MTPTPDPTREREGLREAWRSPDQAPEQASGTERFYVVTVNRKDGKKPFTFAALYLRDFLLEWDDEARHVTGWYSEDSEGYKELLREGDTLLGWQHLPIWGAPSEASTPPARPGREDLRWLADLLIMLADKEDGVGMSYEAPSYRGLSGERLNLYGKRAHAAYRLLSDGKAYASQILALFDGASA